MKSYLAWVQTADLVKVFGLVEHSDCYDTMMAEVRHLFEQQPFWCMEFGRRTADELEFIKRHPDRAIIGTYVIGLAADATEVPCPQAATQLGSGRDGCTSFMAARDLCRAAANRDKSYARVKRNIRNRNRKYGYGPVEDKQ